MIAKLIRWLARAEIARFGAELAQIKATSDQAINLAYVNGYNAGRAIGHGEMLRHLRGDTAEPVTEAVMAKRATAMIN